MECHGDSGGGRGEGGNKTRNMSSKMTGWKTRRTLKVKKQRKKIVGKE